MIQIYVNSKLIADNISDPYETLSTFLKRNGLTGTKVGCAEGGCGSCTVLLSKYEYSTKQIVSYSVNACLIPVFTLHLKHVTTIEALAKGKQLHPVQAAVANSNGSQCGYCTPGIVMSLFAEFVTNPNVSVESIHDCFDGNLCRCTGYRPILDGASKLIGCTSDCNNCPVPCSLTDIEDSGNLFPTELLSHHSKIQNPTSYHFQVNNVQWYSPASLPELLQLVSEFPNAKIINGNTEVGIELRFKNQKYPVFIIASDIAQLHGFQVTENGIVFGASTTIATFSKILKELVDSRELHETRGLQALIDNCKYFAGKQIRNVSAISGNICTASPISDLNPVFAAVGALLTIESKDESRQIKVSDFFLGYRKTALRPGEVLTSVFVPFTKRDEFVGAFKQAKRRDDDIAIVNCGLRVKFELQNGKRLVEDCCFAYGGMGPTTLTLQKSMQYMRGKEWNKPNFDRLYQLVLDEMPLSATSPGGQIEYRKTLAQSFLVKFFVAVNNDLRLIDPRVVVENRELSCISEIERGLSFGKQTYAESDSKGVVGKSVIHSSAVKQVTGEAQYVDDLPPQAGELYGVILGSTVAHGKIVSIDVTECLAYPGVFGFVSAKDLDPSMNIIGPVFKDEELFATEYVYHVGQMIGLVLGTSEVAARIAVKLCKVKYDVLPVILTIEDAIESKSFLDVERKLLRGEFSENNKNGTGIPLASAALTVSGTARMSGQEHFYLETNATLVVPGAEDDEVEVFASTQHPSETQHLVAHVLGIQSNKVVCRVKRLGGGFGGKETRSVFLSCALAVAAKKYKRPVRCMLTREEDMAITGTRHPFRGDYKVGFTSDGYIISLELDMYCNAGYSMDLSFSVLERSMTHCDNAYFIPHVKIIGRMCKTNIPTNTAFRGFGGPQGMMVAEQYITHVAEFLKKPVEEIRFKNLYQNGQVTHFSMPVENVFLERAWKELLISSQFEQKKKQVEEFNKLHKYRKRGVTMMPTKFGLAFTARHLNQAAALVHVYADGSVKIAHGGTEMGQGLHTKMLQVAADAFGIPMNMIHLAETRTDTVINTSATAASVSSDLNGKAIWDACQQIIARLDVIKKRLGDDAQWTEVIKTAYFERINLSANGFYATPDLDFDWKSNTGRMFSYFTYGVACTMVEIDTLSGDHVILSSDIIMDIGRPINPLIDIGQIEGGFTQGLGWCTIEEPLINKLGFLLTRGPGLYKIPGFKDIPVEFNVTVMDQVQNDKAIHSSKAVGEPPLFLGASCFFAIREAIQAARVENGLSREHFRLDSPVTSERLRMACMDEFTARSRTPLLPGERAWGFPS